MCKCHGIAKALDEACFGVNSVTRNSENPPARKDVFPVRNWVTGTADVAGHQLWVSEPWG